MKATRRGLAVKNSAWQQDDYMISFKTEPNAEEVLRKLSFQEIQIKSAGEEKIIATWKKYRGSESRSTPIDMEDLV